VRSTSDFDGFPLGPSPRPRRPAGGTEIATLQFQHVQHNDLLIMVLIILLIIL